MSVLLLFPHQLFATSLLPENITVIYLPEEILFFTQLKFSRHKLVFHRASMKAYASLLEKNGYEVIYIEATESRSDIRILIEELASEGHKHLMYFEPADEWLEQRITGSCTSYHMKASRMQTPMFTNSSSDNATWYGYNEPSFAAFYTRQRQLNNILLEGDQPAGGEWMFNLNTRMRYPKNKISPVLIFPDADHIYTEAIRYVNSYFPDSPGDVTGNFTIPFTHDAAIEWLHHFLEYRFAEFALYEDAILSSNSVLHHSLLSPLLNSGLLLPQQVLDAVLKFTLENNIPFNTAEGYIRQITGWREYIKMLYDEKSVALRNSNYFKYNKKIPAAFYKGNTGLLPFDKTVRKILSTGYANHAERVNILSTMMLFCEIDPGEVYKWFMEMFIDAYDWVVVPNVYGSQWSDGGDSGLNTIPVNSTYLLKTSDYMPGEWTEIWDALHARFIHLHCRNIKHASLQTAIKTFDKHDREKQQLLLTRAGDFLNQIQSK